MTVRRATSAGGDCGLKCTWTSYLSARAGTGTRSAESASDGRMFFGQWKWDDRGYNAYEAFLSYTIPAIPTTDLLVSANITLQFNGLFGSVARDIETREHAFGGTVTTADWVPGADLADKPLLARIGALSQQYSAYTPGYAAGSSALLERLRTGSTTVETVVTTSRLRAGTAPTAEEYGYLISGNASAWNRPGLVTKTVTNSPLMGVGGASAQLSNGVHVWLDQNGGLYWSADAETETEIATIPTGTDLFDMDVDTAGWQTASLCVDEDDSIWVVHKAGNTPNSIVVRCFENAGINAWSAKTPRQLAMPAYGDGGVNNDVPINNIAVTWHNTSNRGHLMIIGGHTAGTGDADSIFWATISCLNAVTGAGSYIAASGTDPGFLGLTTPTAAGTRMTNDSGNGLDVWGDGPSGYVVCFDGVDESGDPEFWDDWPSRYRFGKYTLTSSGTILSYAAWGSVQMNGLQPNTKAKVVPVDDDQVAFCCGGSIQLYTRSGTLIRSNNYASWFPFDGTTTLATDYIYDPAERKVWFYYVDPAIGQRDLWRNGWGIDTGQFSIREAETKVLGGFGVSGDVVVGIRLPRGQVDERHVRVEIGRRAFTGGALDITVHDDELNLPPQPPTITTRSDFDANDSANFGWTYHDANPTDKQSAYQLQITNVATAAIDYDSGKVATGVASALLPAGTLDNTQAYTWKVRTWDLADEFSDYSQQGTFSTLSTAITTITNPVSDNPIDATSSLYLVRWNTTVITQAKYRVRVLVQSTGAVITDTGFVTSTERSYQLTGLNDGVTYRVEVTVRNNVDVESSPGTRLITPDFPEPRKPTIEVMPADTYVTVTITNPPETGLVPFTVPNADFEATATPVQGWFGVGATVTRDTSIAHSGASSVLVTPTGTGAIALEQNGSSKIGGQVAGKSYLLKAWVRVGTAVDGCGLSIYWYGTSGTNLIKQTVGPVTPMPAGEWVQLSLLDLCPEGAVGAVLRVRQAATTVVPMNVDDVTYSTGPDGMADPAYNDVWRSDDDGANYVRIASVGYNGTLRDYAVRSGKSYTYYAEAVV
jgi:hypothetical protein